MKGRVTNTLILVPVLFIGSATAAFAANVERSIEISESADTLWQDIGPFCAIPDWYPGIDSCTEETIDGVVNRRLVTAQGAQFLEKFIETDGERAYGYAIIEGPLPVMNYRASFVVEEHGDKSVLIWASSFDPKDASEQDAVKIITDIYDTGLNAIQARYSE